MGREVGILKLPDERRPKPVSFAVRRETTYRVAAMPPGKGTPITKVEQISVTFQLSDSAEVGRVLLRHRKAPHAERRSMTVAKDASLIVVMKKINGKWYWNPFGW